MYQGHNFSVKIKHVILPRMIALLLGKVNCFLYCIDKNFIYFLIFSRRSKDSPFNFESTPPFLLGFLSEI